MVYFTSGFLTSIPFYLSNFQVTFLSAFFEAISGFTSTGFTIFNNIKHLDESLILWRSSSQWLGGLYFLISIILLIDIFDKNLKNSLKNFINFNSNETIKQCFKISIIYLFLTTVIFFILGIFIAILLARCWLGDAVFTQRVLNMRWKHFRNIVR